MNEDQKPAHPSRLRYAAIAILALVVAATADFIGRHQEARTDAAPAPAKVATDVIEATPEQLKQIHVEAVRDQVVDLDLETTGKVGFNEDRMSPVFSPYTGR